MSVNTFSKKPYFLLFAEFNSIKYNQDYMNVSFKCFITYIKVFSSKINYIEYVML